VSEEGPRAGILGRLAVPGPDRAVPASSVDALLVDADREFRAIVAALLRRSGYTVVEAATAVEGTVALRHGCTPRLLLLGLDGASRTERDALAALRDDVACADSPLLVLLRSWNDDMPGLHPAARLMKPVDGSELVEAVRRLCGTLGG
jgi:DNA-binding response OmpR family regulator